MHAGDARASIDMRQVDPLRAYTCIQMGASRGAARQLAFVEVDCSSVEISGRAVGHCSDLQIVKRLLSAAAKGVTADSEAAFVDLRPGTAPIGRAPDSFISVDTVHKPEVHFITARHHRKLATVHRAVKVRAGRTVRQS